MSFKRESRARWIDVAFDENQSQAWQNAWRVADQEIFRIFNAPKEVALKDLRFHYRNKL
jgi:hypothetical protein